MSDISELTSGVKKLDRWQRLGLAVTCVTSIAPMVERFALRATQLYFYQGLTSAWDAFCKESVDVRAVSFKAGLEELPEMDDDDSNLPAFTVMRVLSILADALDVMLQPDSARFTIDVCNATANFYSSFDVMLEVGPRGHRKIDPKNPPPPGQFESLMLRAQFSMIDEILEAPSLLANIANMQAWADQLRAEVEDVLPVYCGLMGWNLPASIVDIKLYY